MRDLVYVRRGQIGVWFWKQIPDEPGIDSTDIYNGDADIQPEQTNVHLNDANDERHVPHVTPMHPEAWTTHRVEFRPPTMQQRMEQLQDNPHPKTR